MTAPPPALEAVALARRYGPRRAVDGVSFALAPGDCLALFGPNGAGKSTLLKMLGGLLRPTNGEARVAGRAIGGDDGAVRGAVGLISHQSQLYAALTAHENVAFAARRYGVPDPDAAALLALEQLRVAERASTPVRRLSRGLQQRVSIARAIVHAPAVLLCDEPYTGLDTVGADALTATLVALRAAGAALVLVTHQLGEGLALATQVAVLVAGRLAHHAPRAAVDDAAFADAYRALVTA
ncbi:MAG TPA: ABC transporter ATP-binding protein [Gemmatirosa sp.]